MVRVLFVRAKVSALVKVVIGKCAAAALYGANWKSSNFFGIFLQQVAIGRGRKWWVNFLKKKVDLSARALTLRVEDSYENENDDADGVDLSGLNTASTVHTNVVANGNEDEPNISIACESRVLNETTDRDREEEDGANLEIGETTDIQGEVAGTSNGQESAGSSELSSTCHGVQWQVTQGVVEDSRTHPCYSAKLLWACSNGLASSQSSYMYVLSFTVATRYHHMVC